MPRLWDLGLSTRPAHICVTPFALVALGELRDQLPQDHCHRVVLVDRLLLRDDAGVGRHEEGQGCRERAALDAGQADVLGGRLSQAVAEEVPSGEGLKVFDFLHDVQAIKKAPGVSRGLRKAKPRADANGAVAKFSR